MKSLDIIVPVRNESLNIEPLVQRINKALVEATVVYKIIFVDDHSTDDTLAKIESLSNTYPIKVIKKKGKVGKAYAILEGLEHATSEYIIMIDGDLQYPPEAIPEMIKKMDSEQNDVGVVVANRKKYTKNLARKIGSKINIFIFGKLITGINCDIQSGLKLFRRDIVEHMDISNIYGWSIDIPLLHTAKNLGYKIKTVPIDFMDRKAGNSKVSFLQTALEIALGAFKTKVKVRNTYHIKPNFPETMIGAGVIHNKKRFITHTTLHQHKSAITTFITWQKLIIAGIFTLLVAGLVTQPLKTGIIATAILSAIYFIDVLFNLFLILKSLHTPPELSFTKEEIESLKEDTLPVYSILCPLYKEASVLPQFLSSIEKIEWPKNKLDVLLLLEEGDSETITAAQNINLPSYVRTIIVPNSQPKTKPKACNYGLCKAVGEYVVIYDAEDVPDPQQLKKAYLAFHKVAKNVVCLQAKLNYYNPSQNLLTRLFTAEYSLWFDVILTGLQSIETTIPLGGTSNHFRTADLLKLEGWDPFNVTEDCDLGVRLFKEGYKTAIIDSTTLEEANSDFKNWLRQRSRWIKGYIQTYFVHTRNPIKFSLTHKLHALIFQLTVGGKIAFMFINPFLWLATILYFALYSIVGPTIESLYPSIVFYMALTSLVFGNFLYLYYYMIGTAKREHWAVIKYVFLVPFYWLMVSMAAQIALFQLIFKPHYWEKTVHGLHIKKENESHKKLKFITYPNYAWNELLRHGKSIMEPVMGTNFLLVISSFLGSFFDFLYNAYLGRSLDLDDFGLITLVGTLLFIVRIPLSALSRTVTYKSAYFLGEHKVAIKDFWVNLRKSTSILALVITLIWILLIPYLQTFFQSPTPTPFILFTPVWIIGTLSAVDAGFLSGSLKFKEIALIAVVFSLVKFGFTVLLVTLDASHLVYASTPGAMTVTLLLGWYFSSRTIQGKIKHLENKSILKFPIKFFLSSVIIKLSEITFYTTDILLAKHFLTPNEAGQYSMLSLVGKMIFFIGGLFSQFILPMVSHDEGAKKDSRIVFYKLFFSSTVVSLLGFLLVGLFGPITTPILFGNKIKPILYLLPIYGFAMFCFQEADIIISYHQARNRSFFALAALSLSAIQVVAILFYHNNLNTIVMVMSIMGIANFVVMLFFHFTYDSLVRHLVKPLTEVNKQLTDKILAVEGQKILIFNWRDSKHVWAGGAEVYIHELAKRWVRDGNRVTVFCGNDRHSPRYELIDGVEVIRRGGFFFVYLWAFVYYIFKFRGNYDVIIDSENGVPFFTPLYAKEKVFLLIHHVHQEVFRNSLTPPLSWFAMFLEKRVMPLVYRNTQVITVSPSSKADILQHELTKKDPIVIYNGVDVNRYTPGIKSEKPLVLYVGRLKFYKSLNVFIESAKKILEKIPEAEFVIAGSGEDKSRLQRLADKIGLKEKIMFLGKVTEEQKIELYRKAWVFVNPSLMEGWGITTIEANACGTPVVASNVSGLRDSVHNPHSGFLVPYGNVDEFAKTIINLIRDDVSRETMSLEAIAWAKKFDWEKSSLDGKVILESYSYA